MRQNEVTSRIPRNELVGLLDTMAPATAQRVTVELPVSSDALVRFATPTIATIGLLAMLAGLCWAVAS